MGNDEDFAHRSDKKYSEMQSRSMGNHQLVIISQLLQLVGTMHNIDELWQWLSQMIVQRMNVQVVQIWASQRYIAGHTATELRTSINQLPFPLQITYNESFIRMAEQIMQKQQSIRPQDVANLFPHYVVHQLTQYKLNYWSAHFISKPVSLPPSKSTLTTEGLTTPLNMLVTFFFSEMPSPRLQPTISSIFEQAISIARNHSLLLAADIPKMSPPGISNAVFSPHSELPFSFETLIAHRTQESAPLQERNPFATSVVIADRQARRVYHAIDGRKSIANLLTQSGLNEQEFRKAVHFLLQQYYIRLYTPEGQPIDGEQALKFF